MSTYISSGANRFYVGLESAYGRAALVSAVQRFPAIRIDAHQNRQIARRIDKTGTRTYAGFPLTTARLTAFEIESFLTSWKAPNPSGYGPLFQAALGALPSLSAGLVVNSTSAATQVQTIGPHGLQVGSGVSSGNELRFVTSVVDAQTFLVNAPFTMEPQAGVTLSATLTYRLSNCSPSLTIYDYWDPATAVSRLLVGASVDALQIWVNGDLHRFAFSGPAADLLDSQTFASGAAGLPAYPPEPPLTSFGYSIVPGHLGQVWLGGTANRFFTLTDAAITVRNNLQTRAREYGFSYPRAISFGEREVASDFGLLPQDDAQTLALYAAAKNRIPVPAMLQLGQQEGQLMGVFMPSVVPAIPVYDDAKPRLRWGFMNNLAQGTENDEIVIAFA